MRLINVYTFRMQEFFDKDIPPYAILSHTWGPEEITFQDWQAILEFQELQETLDPQDISSPDQRFPADSYAGQQQRKINAIKAKAGYKKVVDFCDAIKGYDDPAKALAAGVLIFGGWADWIWIDTCCIDKTSSAELSEAINSMYRWYQESRLCIVYLSDVSIEDTDYGADFEEDFLNSRWFSRGWTLQELLAPENMMFFDAGWQKIGRKSELIELLVRATRIEATYLTASRSSNIMDDSRTNISLRMSWASRRTTTRSEDMAYCLLGIFGVNMPLLYGEGGQRAFARLQEEIMKESTDHTIFAWGYGMALAGDETIGDGKHVLRYPKFGSLLAPSPAYFVNGHLLYPKAAEQREPPFHMTNKGLQIRLRLRKVEKNPGTYVALLNCEAFFSKDGLLDYPAVGLLLRSADRRDSVSTHSIADGDVFQKCPTSKPITVKSWNYGKDTKNTVFLRRDFDIQNEHFLDSEAPGFDLEIVSIPLPVNPWKLHQVVPPCKMLELRSESTRPPLRYRFNTSHFIFRQQGLQFSFDEQADTSVALVCEFTGPRNLLLKVKARRGQLTLDPDGTPWALTDWSILCKDLDSPGSKTTCMQIPVVTLEHPTGRDVSAESTDADLEEWLMVKSSVALDSLGCPDPPPYFAVVDEVFDVGQLCNLITVFVSESAITSRRRQPSRFCPPPYGGDLIEEYDAIELFRKDLV